MSQEEKGQVLLVLGCRTPLPGEPEKQLGFETAGYLSHDDLVTAFVEAPDVFGCELACQKGSGPRKRVAVVLS